MQSDIRPRQIAIATEKSREQCRKARPLDSLEWGQQEANTNLRKHGVDFADAGTMFHDDHAITIPDEESGEERFAERARISQRDRRHRAKGATTSGRTDVREYVGP